MRTLSWESIVGVGGTLAILFSFYLLGSSREAAKAEGAWAQKSEYVIRRSPPTGIGLLGAEPKPVEASAPVVAMRTNLTAPRDLELMAMSRDTAILSKGALQYSMFCIACHAAADIGGDSPSNLFDTIWYHGSTPSEIERTILEGYLDAGMPPWQSMIPDDDIAAMVAYLLDATK